MVVVPCVIDDEELSMVKGDVLIEVGADEWTEIVEDGWLLCTLNEEKGLVPQNYVKKIVSRMLLHHPRTSP